MTLSASGAELVYGSASFVFGAVVMTNVPLSTLTWQTGPIELAWQTGGMVVA